MINWVSYAARLAYGPARATVELSQLRAILALKELASLAKVGEQLHLSSSAIFYQIRQLEDEIGQKLYERAGKRLLLTAAGARAAECARKILDSHDSALATLKEQGAVCRRTLRLGCGPHSSIRIAPHLLRAFLREFPNNTDVRLTASDDQVLLRDLRVGLLDAVLMSMPVNNSELTEEPLWSYEIVFVLPVTGTRARHTDIEKLHREPFILYRRAVVIDAAYRQFFHDLGFEPNVVMENDEPDSIKELVKLGLGIAVLPMWSVGDDARRGTLRVLRPPKRHFNNYGLLYHRSDYCPNVLSDFRAVAHRWPEWWPLARYVGPPLD